jgi:hypothetical protein
MGTRIRRTVVLAFALGAIPLLLTGGTAGAVAGCQPLAGGFVCDEAGEGNGAQVLAATGDLAAALVLFHDGLTGLALYPRDLTLRAFLSCDAATQTRWVLAEAPGAGVQSIDTGVAC